jgi:hypothetical protein
VVGAVAVLCAFWLLQKFGRRTLFFWGGLGEAIPLLVVGILASVPDQTNAIVWYGMTSHLTTGRKEYYRLFDSSISVGH